MKTGKLPAFLILGFLLSAAACTAGKETNRPGPAPSDRRALDRAKARSAITGRAIFAGAPPPAARIRTDTDPTCGALHHEPMYAEDVVVNEGKLQNVFVWVKQGLEMYTFEPPSEPATITQSGCRYTPHVGGVMVNQTLRIVNGDPTLHNIHCVAEKNPEFNIGQAVQGMASEKRFSTPEVMVRFRCDVHKWMSSYFGVVPHPYFSVTGKDGAYALRNLPPGEYVIEAWHEKYGARNQKISVGDNETREADFSFVPSS